MITHSNRTATQSIGGQLNRAGGNTVKPRATRPSKWQRTQSRRHAHSKQRHAHSKQRHAHLKQEAVSHMVRHPTSPTCCSSGRNLTTESFLPSTSADASARRGLGTAPRYSAVPTPSQLASWRSWACSELLARTRVDHPF